MGGGRGLRRMFPEVAARMMADEKADLASPEKRRNSRT